jgi:hypothetical protein
MSNNPYQAPSSAGELPRIYVSRLAAARNGAVVGSLWAAKWTALVCGPGLILPWIGLAVIGVSRYANAKVHADEPLSYALNLIGSLFLSLLLLGMLILSMALFGAILAAVQEAARFRRRPG